MLLIDVLLLAVGLAMDACVVSAGAGASGRSTGGRATFRLGFHFGLFQFLMPIVGWFAGRTIAEFHRRGRPLDRLRSAGDRRRPDDPLRPEGRRRHRRPRSLEGLVAGDAEHRHEHRRPGGGIQPGDDRRGYLVPGRGHRRGHRGHVGGGAQAGRQPGRPVRSSHGSGRRGDPDLRGRPHRLRTSDRPARSRPNPIPATDNTNPWSDRAARARRFPSAGRAWRIPPAHRAWPPPCAGPDRPPAARRAGPGGR